MFWLIVNWVMLLEWIVRSLIWLRKQFHLSPVPQHVVEEAVSTATSHFFDRQFIDSLKINTSLLQQPIGDGCGEIHQNPVTGNYVVRSNNVFQVFSSMGGTAIKENL